MGVIMENLPKLRFKEFDGSWITRPLGEVLTIGSGRDYKHLHEGDIPVYGTGGYMLSVDNYLYDGESIGIGRKGTIDKPIFLSGKFWTVDTLFYTHSFIEALPKFMFGLFQRIEWLKYNEASGVPSLSKSTLEKIPLKLPSLAEQQKIAAFLTAVDTKIEQLTQKEALLKQYKKGVMQKIFSQEIRFKADDGSEFPEWKESKVSALCDVKKGTQLNKENLTEEGAYPALNGGINPSGYTDDWNTESNSVTISEGGNSCGFVNFVKTRFWSGGHNYSLQNLRTSCSKYYLYQYLKFNEPQIMRLRVGSGLPNIQKSDLNDFAVYTPCLSEQSKIASYLSVLDIKIDQLTSQLDSAKAFKKGLLQQMFV